MVATISDRYGSGSTIQGRLSGAAVLSITGTWWGWAPAARLPITPVIAHAILISVALALLVAARAAIRGYRGAAAPIDRRLMMISIAVEMTAIVLGTNLVANLGRPNLALPVIGLVVGLHFLPMALALSCPPYRVLGLAITLFALLSMALPGPIGLTVLGAGCSVSLLLSSLYMTLQLRTRARTATDALQTA